MGAVHTNPLTAIIIGGLIVAAILGAYHYSRRLVEFNFTDKKLSNILSEMDSLHKDYKKQISNIKKIDNKIIHDILETYDNRITQLYEKHKPSPCLYSNLFTPKINNDKQTS